MTEDEQTLLQPACEAIMQLIRDRDDMVAGLTAVFLDLYRVEFQESRHAKAEALLRLQIQRDRLAQHSARQIGVMFLDSLIQTVEKAQLQPAKPPGGRQLQLRDGSLRSAETQLPITAPPRVNPPGRLLGRFTKGDRTAYAAAEITMLRQELTAAKARIQETGRHNATDAEYFCAICRRIDDRVSIMTHTGAHAGTVQVRNVVGIRSGIISDKL
jgi:hypothetical protein